MTLRVERPTVPAPGADWLYTVPGQYLEDLVGVQATLTNYSASVAQVTDSSGNGHHGIDLQAGGALFNVPGLIAGDTAVSLNVDTPNHLSELQFAPSALLVVGPWTMEWWQQPDSAVGFVAQIGGINTSESAVDLRNGICTIVAAGIPESILFAPITSGAPVMVAVVYDGANLASLYLNGALAGTVAVLVVQVPANTAFYRLIAGYPPPALTANGSVVDELAVWPSALTAGQIAAHFAAAGTFATYSAAVLADVPTSYWHLDDVPLAPTGRLPALVVTNGTAEVGAWVPTAVAAAGGNSFAYSWMVDVANSSQVNAGQITTVGLPKLVLPAGYTVGTATADLGTFDQWSDITVWWDDAYQQAQQFLTEYLYPPGAHLVYQQQKVTP